MCHHGLNNEYESFINGIVYNIGMCIYAAALFIETTIQVLKVRLSSITMNTIAYWLEMGETHI